MYLYKQVQWDMIQELILILKNTNDNLFLTYLLWWLSRVRASWLNLVSERLLIDNGHCYILMTLQ